MAKRGLGKFGDSKGVELLKGLRDRLRDAAGPGQAGKQTQKPHSHPSASTGRGMCSPSGTLAKASSKSVPPLTTEARRAMKKLKMAGSAQAKKAGVQFIRPKNAQERAALLEAQGGSQTETAVPAKASGLQSDFGESAYRRLGPLRDSLEGFAADDGSSDAPTSEDCATLNRRIILGASKLSVVRNHDDGSYLGYDFGTSTTKVVSRYPYGPVDQAFAIDVPLSIASDAQPHLFPTTVYYAEATQHFTLCPQPGSVKLDSFKSALIHGRGHWMCRAGVTMAEAATAFVALHMAYCLGAAVEQRPDFQLASFNVGVPVASLDQNDVLKLFKCVIASGARLIPEAPSLALGVVRAAIAGASCEADILTVHAELSGAVAGYCQAVRTYVGGHLIIDCGSATLDMVAFDRIPTSRWPIGIHSARVDNLGADACALFLRQGFTEEECKGAIRFEEHQVFRDALQRRRNQFAHDGKFHFQVILVGGGIDSPIHQQFLDRFAQAFDKPLVRPTLSQYLIYDERCAASRLLLADGLARDPNDLKAVALPKPPPPPEWHDPLGPSKDQV